MRTLHVDAASAQVVDPVVECREARAVGEGEEKEVRRVCHGALPVRERVAGGGVDRPGIRARLELGREVTVEGLIKKCLTLTTMH